MTLPTKPDAVAHVSDAHWEAALDKTGRNWKYYTHACILPAIIDHARCLILLNEVPEPVDSISLAASQIWGVANGPHCDAVPRIEAAIRKHLAGMAIPEATQ
jgi:hypothetical protein